MHKRSLFLQEAHRRGFFHQCTHPEALDHAAATSCIVAYIGFDATAPSLHVGSLVPIMLLRLLQDTGHKPLVLLGGGTTRIGDPSGKDKSRTLLDEERIQSNLMSLRTIFSRFLRVGEGPTDALILDNSAWLDELNYISFLRTYGRHFSVNKMLKLDSVRLRLERESPLSFLEFNYMVLQAYDFLVLSKTYGCTLQMGGADQWGNIVGGVDLAHHALRRQLYGLTAPLLTTAQGEKMGKTAQGAVWLDPELLSPYDYWQYWRNVDDKDVGRFLRLLTFESEEEICRLEALQGSELNEAKKRLATQCTALCHGQATALEVARRTSDAFENNLWQSLPRVQIPSKATDLVSVLCEAGLAPSRSEARRLIRQGGVKVEGEVFSNPEECLLIDTPKRISVGKKRHVLVEITPLHTKTPVK